jgi:L-amino acid N-acyltransferase YncA
LHLRRATIDDALDVLAWRNDPHTRAMSRDDAAVDRQVHLDWFAGAVEDPSRLLLVGEADGRGVGMVRFDRAGDRWEVSINIAPDARGRGLGAALLGAGLELFAETHAGVEVLAVIKPENATSLRLFEGLGFRPAGGAGDLLHFLWRAERR